jgi:uncharacterized protein YyaL (SSP411 family)
MLYLKGDMKIKIIIFAVVTAVVMILNANGGEKNIMKHLNRLKNEKSLYLLQHADNPVDWYPWGKEAFDKARTENKPIFLSIGYSSCHWCHVMADKCFSDEKVARALNDTFVCIKVDREMRPDIDYVYMQVCQLLTGSGGWPLNVMLTPELKPFSAATYIPPENLINAARQVGSMWKSEREKLIENANSITSHLYELTQRSTGTETLASGLEDDAWRNLKNIFDPVNGGFGTAPKFPAAHRLLFLMRYWYRSDDPEVLKICEQTLASMRHGGIYDQLNSGFHRYSIDAAWKVPHFEKMLCDQALLAMAYTDAFMITGKPSCRSIAEDILKFVLRDMKSPDGGFYSALYADEAYYLFSVKELRKILTPGELELVGDLYGVKPEGNFKPETGSNTRKLNIIYMNSTLHALAARLNTSENFLRAMDKTIRSKMSNYQRQRKRPFADNKVLTGWNSLMIVALLKAANAFSNEEFKHAALENASLLLNKMFMPDGSLCRALINGQAQGHGVLKDYAYTIWALLELYNSTFDEKYLARAESLTDYTERFFGDSENGGYFDSSTESESLIIRPRNVFDDAIPSGGTTMMLNLLKLGTLTGKLKYIALAEKDGNSMAADASQSPENTSMIMNSLMYAQSPPWQVVIVGRRGQSDTEDILQAFKRSFIPFTSVRYFEADRSGLAADGVHRMQNAACTVYVYRNKVRLPPMHDLTQISKILNLKHK